MKTAHDPRHQQRIAIVQQLFAYSFHEDITPLIEPIVPHLPEIDARIAAVATQRPLDQMNKLDLAILREAVFELVYKNQERNIMLDEAIEIARLLGSETSAKFMNAVLSKIV
ncbi:hypothetical protein C5B42_04925 [Candidatus Cerribacteria bacterium 'Amazon FNV 2010 28 9']|uniref:NusB/RsmB/TIM44 domain-containing protein n=1 Tax=Candidatus Cerribacteria bacterium 'Amazon FNV 2010 28 9' TaxID=2081795 RepID=A0A317JMM3_9BACT|nr:MAG: hypothetical protein C5B42_04925 [Candidatus Cerribacteria bacterium 'Amazon FNV 2010 28 9']